jgi:hypothetical protein
MRVSCDPFGLIMEALIPKYRSFMTGGAITIVHACILVKTETKCSKTFKIKLRQLNLYI